MTDPTREQSDIPPEYNPFAHEDVNSYEPVEPDQTQRLAAESWLPIGLGMAFLSIFGCVIVVGILVAVLKHFQLLYPSVMLALGGLSFHGAALVGILAALFWRVPAGKRGEAMKFHRLSGMDILLVAGMLIGLMVTSYVMLQISAVALDLIGYTIKDDQKLEMLLKGSPDAWIAMGILAVIVAPFTEEIMFRRVLYGSLKWIMEMLARPFSLSAEPGQMKTTIQAIVAATFTSGLFALIHMEPVQFLSLFCLAMGLQYALYRSQNLFVPILIHLLFNSWTVLLLSIARIFNLDIG